MNLFPPKLLSTLESLLEWKAGRKFRGLCEATGNISPPSDCGGARYGFWSCFSLAILFNMFTSLAGSWWTKLENAPFLFCSKVWAKSNSATLPSCSTYKKYQTYNLLSSILHDCKVFILNELVSAWMKRAREFRNAISTGEI